MSDKLTINNEMRVLDAKHRKFYSELTEEERKKFSPYIIMRYAASVEGSADFQEWYLRSTNERVNVNFFEVGSTKHKELQWLLCTTVSPNMGTQRHYWIAPKKSESTNANVKLLQKLYPHLKSDELELLAQINDAKSIREQAKAHGFEDRDIKTR